MPRSKLALQLAHEASKAQEEQFKKTVGDTYHATKKQKRDNDNILGEDDDELMYSDLPAYTVSSAPFSSTNQK